MRELNKIKSPAPKRILVAVVSILLIIMAGCSKEEAYRQIKVYEIDGSATVTREGTGEVEPYVNMMLQNRDAAETAMESYVQLQLDDDKYILMEPSTKIELEATGDSVDSKTKINLIQGAIVNKIENALSEDSSYEVTTPNSTLAVRGTTFRVEVLYDEYGESYTTITVCEGKVECRLIAPDGTVSEEAVVLEEGEQIKVRGTSDISEYLGDKETFDFEEFKEKVLGFIGYIEEVTEIETETEVIEETETEIDTDVDEEKETSKKEPDSSEVEADEESSSSAETETEEKTPESTVIVPNLGITDAGLSNSGSSNSGSTGSESPDSGSTDSESSNSGTTTPTSYTVTFKDSSGNVFATQTVTSGGTATQPILCPEAAGDWNFDFSTAINADTEIMWTPN